MRCYGFSKVGLSMTPSAWNFRNSVLKTRYVQISGKAERDGWTCMPFDGRQLKRYIASMFEVVEA